MKIKQCLTDDTFLKDSVDYQIITKIEDHFYVFKTLKLNKTFSFGNVHKIFLFSFKQRERNENILFTLPKITYFV